MTTVAPIQAGSRTPKIIDCPQCRGEGTVEHVCTRDDLRLLRTLFRQQELTSYCYQALYGCAIPGCHQVWKVVFHQSDGRPPRETWLRPGDAKDGFEFTSDEYEREVIAA